LELKEDLFTNASQKMYVNISNIGSMNLYFFTYQSRGKFGQFSALQGAKSLFGTLDATLRRKGYNS